KSHPVVSKNIFFTPDVLHRRRLRIAAVGTNRPTLVFEKGDTVTSDGEVIFHELNMNQDELLYLEFAFPAQDARYREVKKIENDLDKELQTIADDALLKEIDHALDKHDQELFQRLVKMLKRSTQRQVSELLYNQKDLKVLKDEIEFIDTAVIPFSSMDMDS